MRKILALALSCAVAVSLLGCGSAQSAKDGQTGEAGGKKVRIMIGYENNPGEPIDLACQEWKRLIEEKSGDTMRVDLYPSSQLGSKDNIIDQAVNGDCVVTLANGPFFQDRGIQDFGVLFAPYLFEGWEDVEKVVDSQWFAGKARELEQNVGLKILTTWRYGIRHTITKKPVNAVSDLKGKKVRVPNQTILIKVFESLGATPTPMAMSDIYTALQQGTIDGAENPLPVILNGAYQEVAKNLVLDAHTYDMTCWIMGADFFNTLTPEQQQILMECGDEAGVFNSEQIEKADEEALEALKAAGVTVSELTPEDFKVAGEAFYEDAEIKAMWSEGLIDEIKDIISQ